MELLFLWVDDFKIFKHTGFNFSSKFEFESEYFLDKDNIENVRIKVNLNPNYINLFPEAYLNVTAVLGQNASGKTTLFNLLKLFSGDLSTIAARIVFCYRNEDSENTIHTVYYESGREKPALKVKISKAEYNESTENINTKGFVLKNPEPYKIDLGKGLNKEAVFKDNNLNNVTPIFFSNSFDTHREDVYEKIVNISTNYLVFDSAREFLKTYERKDDSNTSFLNQVNPLIEFFDVELKSQIKYITYAKKKKLIDIPLPEYLMIGFNKDDFNYLKNRLKDSYLFDQGSLDRIDKYAMEKISTISNPTERIISIIYLLAFYYAIKVDLFQQASNVPSDLMYKKINEISESKNIFQSIKDFITEVKPFNETGNVNRLKDLYGGRLEKLLLKAKFESEKENHFRFKFAMNSNLWEILDVILSVQYLNDRPFLNYSWYGISSGQEAFLRQYSRFYSIKDSVANRTLWIMIDEGELYFHPEWQKEYVHRIIDFLPKIFPSTRIQLFLSSHSPFVASDLPKSNIVFLHNKHEENQKTFDIKETFGSNIHTLFTSSFFLSGLLGDFAKSKIDAAIDYLNNKPQKEFGNDEDVQSLIRIIGEPILKNQLQKMLDSKRIESLEGKYKNLEKRVGKIEKKGGKNDTNK